MNDMIKAEDGFYYLLDESEQDFCVPISKWVFLKEILKDLKVQESE